MEEQVEQSGSWWLENFKERLPQEQLRMKRELPCKGTNAYLKALEDWEEQENLQGFSPRTRKAHSGILSHSITGLTGKSKS